MGLKQQFEQYDIITDEDIARGMVYSWTLMVMVDGRVEGAELEALEGFAKSHKTTRRFHRDNWLDETVAEALNVYNAEGPESLFGIIKEQLTNSSIETKRVLLFSMLKMACVDEDFCDRELDLLERMVEILGIGRRDILMIGMLYAAHKETEEDI
ncbi:MAG: hypothetical protein GY940_46170 [bacterium]|nr:hypothetical protein [bacterium]